MRILSLSPHGVLCGIAAYNAALKSAFEAKGHVYDVERIDPPSLANASTSELIRHFRRFVDRAVDYDAIVLQHEWGFFMGAIGFKASYRVFSSILAGVRETVKPVFAFFHSTFPVHHPSHARQLAQGEKNKKFELQSELVSELNCNPHLSIVVHGRLAKRLLAGLGVNAAKITPIVHPVPSSVRSPCRDKSSSCEEVNLLIFGFVTAYKGYDTALAALRLLPDNFKLIIAGGKHPNAPRDRTLDAIYGYLQTGEWLLKDANSTEPLMETLRLLPEPERCALRARVRVTGPIPDEEVMSVLATADIVLAPYTDRGPPGSGALAWVFAVGRPVVATAVHTFVEIQEDWDCMKLVSPNSLFELAEAIRDLVDRPEQVADLVEKGCAFAEANSFDRLADSMLADLAAHHREMSEVEASC